MLAVLAGQVVLADEKCPGEEVEFDLVFVVGFEVLVNGDQLA